MTFSGTYDQLVAIGDPKARLLGAIDYETRLVEALKRGRRVRDEALLVVAEDIGLSAASRFCGLSVSHIKQVKRDAKAREST